MNSINYLWYYTTTLINLSLVLLHRSSYTSEIILSLLNYYHSGELCLVLNPGSISLCHMVGEIPEDMLERFYYTRKGVFKSSACPYPAKDPVGPEIIHLLNTNNRKAFETVYTELYPNVFYFACRFVGRDEAKDITANAFLKLWKGDKKFESLKKVKIFLQVCVRNACFTYIQRTRFHQEKNRELALMLENSTNDESELPGVKSGLIKKILFEIEKLPPGARQIFKLSVIEGMESKEIASRLSIRESTVRNQKKRAIALLRLALVNS